ncbi:cytidylate kinase-like family protein [Draconibacterium sp. IB214405]|uniref:cytidylate kinase-like family protein n=1 Tax=Draconibacterium sp. IB214405 TaxID=3097352 RepID=UPI002A15E463|nr:cytidylate kinase-like family protein [Draconibacterium sp. IB214405]MDX8339654.1 cytidylate kinase-like family protein [Draconibacterium sp. IB214405]
MGNSLMNYLNRRLKEANPLESGNLGQAGPVITISREVGCNGLVLARMIAERLNKQLSKGSWNVLSKEIFRESAKELDLDPEKVRQTFKKTDRYTFEEILNAFKDKRYKSEEVIIKTVREVVRTLAVDGYCIIVGRASHIIASDIKNALHIRLTAPLGYRINTIMTNNKLNRNEAIAFIEKVEKERTAFRKALKESSLREEFFDLTINRGSFTNEQAVDLVEYAVEKKGLLLDYKPKIEFY